MRVQAIRHLFAQRHLAVMICAATLLLKLLVPTGYMIGTEHGRVAIILCAGSSPAAMTAEMPGMHGDMAGHANSNDHGQSMDHGPSKDHGKTDMPCAFSGLSAAVLSAIDPIQLAALIVFVMALGLTLTVIPAPSRPAHLRPPLRGPPAYL